MSKPADPSCTEPWVIVRFNSRSGWRNRLGMLLREIASRIDRRHGLTVEIFSSHAMSSRLCEDCMSIARDTIAQAVVEELRHEVIEADMKARSPHLYAAPAVPATARPPAPPSKL